MTSPCWSSGARTPNTERKLFALTRTGGALGGRAWSVHLGQQTLRHLWVSALSRPESRRRLRKPTARKRAGPLVSQSNSMGSPMAISDSQSNFTRSPMAILDSQSKFTTAGTVNLDCESNFCGNTTR